MVASVVRFDVGQSLRDGGYDLTVTLLADGQQVDTVRRRIGFRTVAVDTEPDEIGTPFTFVVNGKRVFAKGANWIPDDHLLTRVTRERLARRIDQAVDANMNMLRLHPRPDRRGRAPGRTALSARGGPVRDVRS